MENNQLKHDVDDLRAKQSILDDDRVLANIEASFQQFHAFLDLLKEAGSVSAHAPSAPGK